MIMTTDARVLVAARLSRLVKDRDQLSIERQDDQARRYAAEAGDAEPILAPDPGVSGAVSPFKRPKLGPYLTDTPPEPWTELVASAIDRLGRNARDLNDLKNWCVDNGKRITILSPRLHWPPAENDFASPIVWAVLEQLAEIELRMTTKRYADTRDFIRDRKSMLGKPCWGFRITGAKLAKTITPDPVKVPYLLGMIEMALAGKSQNDIAAWLDSQGALPREYEIWVSRDPDTRKAEPSRTWSPKSVGQILRNESLYGVYRENGKILLRHDGVIDKEQWDALQAKLDSNPKRRGPTRNDPALLTDVLHCAKCRGIMHARRKAGSLRKDGTRAEPWIGYRCDGKPREPSTCENMVRADDIEAWADTWFTRERAEIVREPHHPLETVTFANEEITEEVPVPAKGFTDEVGDIDSAIDALDKNDPGWLAEVNRLYAEREHYTAMGTVPAHTEPRPMGITVGAYWRSLDTAGRRDYMCRAGIKFYATKDTRWITGDPTRVRAALTHIGG